jgi:hypothetical protein
MTLPKLSPSVSRAKAGVSLAVLAPQIRLSGCSATNESGGSCSCSDSSCTVGQTCHCYDASGANAPECYCE